MNFSWPPFETWVPKVRLLVPNLGLLVSSLRMSVCKDIKTVIIGVGRSLQNNCGFSLSFT